MIVETVKAILEGDPTVAGFVGDRIYPVTMPDAPTYPLLVITRAGGGAGYDLQGDIGLERARVQIDVHTDGGAAECIAIKKAVRAKLSAYRGGPDSGHPCIVQGMFCINDTDLTEPATERAGPRVRRRMLEFQIWNKES